MDPYDQRGSSECKPEMLLFTACSPSCVLDCTVSALNELNVAGSLEINFGSEFYPTFFSDCLTFFFFVKRIIASFLTEILNCLHKVSDHSHFLQV